MEIQFLAEDTVDSFGVIVAVERISIQSFEVVTFVGGAERDAFVKFALACCEICTKTRE